MVDFNPFDRGSSCTMGTVRCGRCSCALPGKGTKEYAMSKFLNEIYSNARPMLLLRTNSKLDCSCVNLQSGTGSMTCTRCFGLGKVVIQLERIGCYMTSATMDNNNLSLSGLDRAQSKTGFMHRNIRPSEGQLLLDVEWSVPYNQVYSKGGTPLRLNNVYWIKNVEYIGFNEPVYIKVFTVTSNDRLPYIEQMLRNNDSSLHKYVNNIYGGQNDLRKAATELCLKCM